MMPRRYRYLYKMPTIQVALEGEVQSRNEWYWGIELDYDEDLSDWGLIRCGDMSAEEFESFGVTTFKYYAVPPPYREEPGDMDAHYGFPERWRPTGPSSPRNS